MIVKIEQKHIDNASPSEPDKCPVALALQEAGFENPTVGQTRWYFPGFAFDLPQQAREFVAAFDAGNPVVPFEFEVPDDYEVQDCIWSCV